MAVEGVGVFGGVEFDGTVIVPHGTAKDKGISRRHNQSGACGGRYLITVDFVGTGGAFHL